MQSFTRISTRVVLGAVALFTLGGCYAGGGGYGGSDYYYDEYGYDAQPAYYYDSYHDHDHHHGYRRYRDYHRGSRRQPRVPRDAEVVANGRDGLAYTPDRPGRVYVRDERTGKVIYRGRVEPGQDVLVGADARGRRVSVDGRTARGDLSAKPREREVYFRPDRGTVARPARERAAEGRRERSPERAPRERSAERAPRERGEGRGSRGGGKNKD